MYSHIKILYVFLFTACCACGKDETPAEKDPPRYPIRGTLQRATGYDKTTSARAQGRQQVYIRIAKEARDTSDYFYAATTGADGSFTFYVTDPTKRYEIFSTSSSRSSPTFFMHYYGNVFTQQPLDTVQRLTLLSVADSALHNGLDITTQDVSGSRVGRASLLVYTSRELAVADGDTFSGNAALTRAATDSMGRAFVSSLPAVPLYVNARIISGADTFSVIAVPFQLTRTTIAVSTLALVRK